ncbi:MAG TPA: hypothetical protein VIC62_02660 [Nakamurella sp.]|jgi:hypothetical protein
MEIRITITDSADTAPTIATPGEGLGQSSPPTDTAAAINAGPAPAALSAGSDTPPAFTPGGADQPPAASGADLSAGSAPIV